MDLQPKDPVGHSAAAIWGGHCDSHRFAAQSFGFCDFLLSHRDHVCSTDCILPCRHIENGSINALQVKMVLSYNIQIVNRNHISTYWKSFPTYKTVKLRVKSLIFDCNARWCLGQKNELCFLLFHPSSLRCKAGMFLLFLTSYLSILLTWDILDD